MAMRIILRNDTNIFFKLQRHLKYLQVNISFQYSTYLKKVMVRQINNCSIQNDASEEIVY